MLFLLNHIEPPRIPLGNRWETVGKVVYLINQVFSIMATIKYRLRGKTKNASIYAKLSIDRSNVFEKKTGLAINPKDWSVSTSYPKQTVSKNKSISSQLRTLESHILDKINEGQAEGITFSSQWLEDQIDLFFGRRTESGISEFLTDAIDHIITTAPQRKNNKGGLGLSKSRVNDYRALKRIITEYEGVKKTKIKQIDRRYGDQLLTYLLNNQGYEKGYALRIIDNLKSVCRDAASNGAEVSPQLAKLPGGKVKNEFIIYLTPKELKQIEKAKIITPYLQNARKWLLIGCEIGQRGSDLLNLTDENIVTRNEEDYIELTQQKGNKRVAIPIMDELNRLLIDGLPHKISLQRFNEYIKEVCKIAEINTLTKGRKRDINKNRYVTGSFPKYELITSHICRRSFATNNFGEMPNSIIMGITGHSSEKTFLGYIGKSEIDSAQQFREYYNMKQQKAKKQSNLRAVKKSAG